MPDKKNIQLRAKKFTKEKEKLLDTLSDNISFWQDNKIKLYTKDLSPACKTCFQGKSIDVNINHICSRACFYCPVPTKKDWDPYLALDHVNLKTPQDLIDFVSKFDIETVSFSGGDPMLTFDLLLKYVQSLKIALGKTVYCLVYTNGDGFTEERAKLLGKAGLDEMRINLSARNYDFAPIILARKYIPRVVISSPAVPEEYRKMKKALAAMDKTGVDNLNIIELMAAPYNQTELAKRKYLIKPYNAVAESEIAAYKLLKHAIQTKAKTPVHFCTASYKARSCRMGRNLRYAPYAKEPGDEVTRVGKIRSLLVYPRDQKKFTTWLKKNLSPANWAATKGGAFCIPVEKLDFLEREHVLNSRRELHYYDTYVASAKPGWKGKKIEVNTNLFMVPLKKLSGKVSLKDGVDTAIFINLFVHGKSLSGVMKDLQREYPKKDESFLAGRIYTLHERLMDQEYFGNPNRI